ncbi:GNAT family N-acyltransferase [Sulfitobacter sp. HNIBRBA3233]|uniref:GNAT family N-acetyltransferase n=1 Tax=Sulfitobacter marinivivus TaxID=3158558 RepID=UPI0032DF0F8E
MTQHYRVKLASTDCELRAAQRLRYRVFVEELGGGGDMVDHDACLECDRFDPFFDHMIVMPAGSDEVIGVYRLLRSARAEQAGGFYSEDEYDLSPLKNSGRTLLELGRSCLHRDHRGGLAMHRLWAGVAEYIRAHRIEILFGVASFHGTDVQALAAPLSLLHHRHLAPSELRVTARAGAFQRMDLIAEDALDRRTALLEVPSLIKAYLRLGGCVGEGAFIDYGFNTTDVCLVLDTAKMNERQARLYDGRRA